MDIQRLILWLVFSFSALMLWQAWEHERNPPAVAPAHVSAPAANTSSGTPAAGAPPAATAKTPAAGAGSEAVPHEAAGAAVPGAATTAVAIGKIIAIRTDLYTVYVDTLGGVIRQDALAKHRAADDMSKPYLVLQKSDERTFVAQAGLVGTGFPNHLTPYEAVPGPRSLPDGADHFDLVLEATAKNGDKVEQTLTFHRGSYVIDVAFHVTNAGTNPITPEAYFQFLRDTKSVGAQSRFAPSSFVGPVVYDSADKYKKISFEDIDKHTADPSRKLPYTSEDDNGWIGMVEHYFVVAWLPPEQGKVERRFYTTKLDSGLYTAGVRFSEGAIAPGTTGTIEARLYAGPQDQEVLGKLAPGLNLVVDYGMFTIIAEPLFLLLKFLHRLIGNWGFAIIVMTILIKGAFYPLNATSARSMAKMRLITPKMKALQEQYADDKQKLQMKMMELYKQEKINPLGGCLPIVVQIPVFIALYWVLLSAVELRHAPWIGWIHDLAAPDPLFILPVIYAITAYLQVKLSPTPVTDPMQAKIMQIMPVAFSIMFLFFPSGLVLYWLVNNSLQILQQWHVNRMLTREAERTAAKRR
ncbi:MAG TPA: membrane protein insertase YidC [Casimicrobiaceae bacterium]|nr:membrane protein insertase YidC [Casimicrobiaceae bacterium]